MTRRNRHDWVLTLFQLLGLGVVIIILCVAADVLSHYAQAAEPAQQAIYGGPAKGAPWYVTLIIQCWPGIFAVILTIATGVFIKRMNRSLGNQPLKVPTQIKYTLLAGALWGPLLQWGLQEAVSDLVGIPTNWKLIVLAPFITGAASMVAYDMLRWYTKPRWPTLYEMVTVRHQPGVDYTDSNAPSDLTQLPSDNDDTPTPKGGK